MTLRLGKFEGWVRSMFCNAVLKVTVLLYFSIFTSEIVFVKGLLFIAFRYEEKNTRGHSLYCPYSKEVPSYLHNRPKPVIDAARNKITLAEDTSFWHQPHGVFKVKSQDALKRWYLVSFGNEVQQPSCECPFWVRASISLPYLGIIQNGWEKLSHHYTNSPFLTLDEASIGQLTNSDISPQDSPVAHDIPESSVPSCNIQSEPAPN